MTHPADDVTLVCEWPDCGRAFTGRSAAMNRGRHMAAHERKAAADTNGAAPTSPPAPDESPSLGADEPGAGGETPPVVESPPMPRRPSWRERIKARGRGRSGGGPAAAPAAGRPAKPRPGRRVPLDTDISDVWAFLGRRLDASPHYPTGRMLQYQAPAAGLILDRAIAGTLPDRMVLQPLARGRDKWEDAAFLIAAPLVTFGITRTMQLIQVAQNEGRTEDVMALSRRLEVQFEGFAWLLEMMLPRLAEGKKRAEAKRAEQAAVVLDAFPELAGTDTSPADLLRDMLFAPPSTWEAPDNGTSDRDSARDSGPDSVAV